jgi:predicted DsbA family dithiol-disulfide isomerase
VCPWCYIGYQRIEELEREFPVEVEWRPFELHPETPRTGADLRGRLGSSERARAYRDNIIALANDSGIEMHMPVVVANSHLSLEAAECVRATTPELFRDYHRALFHAYFEERRDLGDVDVLCEIARNVGANDQALRQALADGTYAAVIDETTNAAREDEILSTPTFIYEESGFRLTGAQDYAVFRSITQRLLARRAGVD